MEASDRAIFSVMDSATPKEVAALLISEPEYVTRYVVALCKMEHVYEPYRTADKRD